MIKNYKNNTNSEYIVGDKVYHASARKHGIVVEQVLNDDNLIVWGNVIVVYDNDTLETLVPCWQLSRVVL